MSKTYRYEELISLYFRKKLRSGRMVFVYFIQKGKFVKIGSSTSPERRLKTLQTGTNQKLELIFKTPFYNEKSIHEKFDMYRDHNEWFYFSKEIKEFIEKNKQGDLSRELFDLEEGLE